MIIAVASGKGGTGKTTVSVNLALSLPNVQLIDCDVEEPNAAIFIDPVITETKEARVPVPRFDKNKCTFCGKCSDVCEYNAIAVLPRSQAREGNSIFLPDLCHGCGACEYFCPAGAISETYRPIGVIEFGDRDTLQFIHGKLNIGKTMSPPLIRQVKQFMNPTRTVILDSPPGTSCPVITAVEGADFCVLVTEPTPFGLNDLQLAVETLRKLRIPFGVVINRSDLGEEKTERYCSAEEIPVLMKIPFSEKIAESYSRGEPIIMAFPEYKDLFQQLYQNIEQQMKPESKDIFSQETAREG